MLKKPVWLTMVLLNRKILISPTMQEAVVESIHTIMKKLIPQILKAEVEVDLTEVLLAIQVPVNQVDHMEVDLIAVDLLGSLVDLIAVDPLGSLVDLITGDQAASQEDLMVVVPAHHHPLQEEL